jgi:hypothetical protein
MFRWLFRSPRPSARKAPRRVPLTVECLETRFCPAAPQLTLSATILSGQTVQVSGTVTADDPSTVSVAFTGVVGGSTAVNADGTFSCTAQASALGAVFAQATDAAQQTSDVAEADLTSSSPTVTFTVTPGANGSVTVAGQVIGDDVADDTITFTGAVNGSMTAAPDGSFRYTATPTASGLVQVFATDVWGQTSDPAQQTADTLGPVITAFGAVQAGGNNWTFSGTVNASNPDGLTVQLGGLPDLQGVTASVGPDGTFTVTVQLPPGECGTASAQVCDAWGNTSYSVSVLVSPTNANGYGMLVLINGNYVFVGDPPPSS